MGADVSSTQILAQAAQAAQATGPNSGGGSLNTAIPKPAAFEAAQMRTDVFRTFIKQYNGGGGMTMLS